MTEEIECRSLIQRFAEKNGSVTSLQWIVEDGSGVIIDEISDLGLINHIYKVTKQDGTHSLIIKYGQEKSKMLNFTLTLERQDLEYNALELMHSIYPGGVPQPYCLDKDLHIIAMEDLSKMALLGASLRNGEIDIRHATMLGKVFSAFHHHTHRNVLSEDKWKNISSQFRVKSLREFYEAFRFINIFQEGNPQNAMPDGGLDVYRQCIGDIEELKIQEKLLTAFRREDCIIHSDIHSYSMFAAGDRVAIFDWEFATPGNPAHDVSFLICDYFITQNESCEKYPERKDEITELTRSSIHTFVDEYIKGRTDINTTADKSAFMSEVLLFLGSTFFSVALFPVSSFLTLTSEQRKRMMKMGCDLMKTHQVTNFNGFPDIVENLLWNGSQNVESI